MEGNLSILQSNLEVYERELVKHRKNARDYEGLRNKAREAVKVEEKRLAEIAEAAAEVAE